MDPREYVRKYLARVPPGLRGPRPAASLPALDERHYLPRRRPRRHTAAVADPVVFRRRRLRPYGGPQRAQAARGGGGPATRGISRDSRSRAGRSRASCGRTARGAAHVVHDADPHGKRRNFARHRAASHRRARGVDELAPDCAGSRRWPSREDTACAYAGALGHDSSHAALRGADVVDSSQRGSGGGVQAWAGPSSRERGGSRPSARRCSRRRRPSHRSRSR